MSQFEKIQKIRSKTRIELPECSVLKDTLKLRDYQTVDVYQMLCSKVFVSSLATGLGKTIVTITTYAYIKQSCPKAKMIVFAPRSALLQWKSEIEKFTNNLNVFVLKAQNHNKTQRLEIYKNFFKSKNSDVLITTYGILKNDNDLITKCASIYRSDNLDQESIITVYDEAAVFKSTKTQTYIAALSLSKVSDRVYALSATCLLNRLDEMYGIFTALNINPWGSFTKFIKNYCDVFNLKVKKGNRVIKIPQIKGYKNLQHFKQSIYIHFQPRSKESVAKDLPFLITKTLDLDMTELQKKKYEETETGLLNLSEEESREITNVLAKITVCQQISNSPSLVGIENVLSSKEEELIRLLENELLDEKIIVYTRFKSWVNRLEKILKSNYKILRVTGDESSEEIENNKQKFLTDPSYKIIFITTAGSKSLNLQSASTIIFMDTPYSYGEYLQLLGRLSRIGSTHKSILALHMINCDLDRTIMEHLSKKKILFDEVYGDQASESLNFTEYSSENEIKTILKNMQKILSKPV